MIRYVLGFVFNKDMSSVLLIRKDHPDWQKGLVNGIGGHIEVGECSAMAMYREFKEEAGLEITEWRRCIVLKDYYRNYEVTVFKCTLDDLTFDQARTMTDEVVFAADTCQLPDKVIFNLRWMIPMLKDYVVFPIDIMYADMPGDSGEKRKL